MKITKIYIALLWLVISSCAQFVPPTGGPSDKTAPVLVSSIPNNKTLNFKGKSLELTFDEYVEITSLKQELVISPNIEGTYTIKQKNKTIKLNFEEPFKDSTTYTFNFRNGIKDLNERNPAKNLKLVLSTSSIIDSLSIKGKIKDIHSKKYLNDITVGLFENDTLPLNKKKPAYFIKTDSAGKYEFENIKNGKYFLMAFNDKNLNLIYDQKTENIGFHPDTIILNKNLEIPDIEIYYANRLKNKIKKTISREKEFILQLDKSTKNSIIQYDNDSLINYLPFKSTAAEIKIFKLKDFTKDTTNIKVILTDSLNNKDTLNQKVYFTKPLKSQKTKIETIRINSTIKNGQSLTSEIKYILDFEYPITKYNLDLLKFKTDTLEQEKPTSKWNSVTQLELNIKTKAKREVELLIMPNTFENYKGDTNALIQIKNKVLQTDELATLQGSSETQEGTKIAQLINVSTGQITQEKLFTDIFTFVDIIPDTYNIKVIFDTNKNGIWDPGDIYNKTLPEIILLSKEPIRVKANFELKDIKIN